MKSYLEDLKPSKAWWKDLKTKVKRIGSKLEAELGAEEEQQGERKQGPLAAAKKLHEERKLSQQHSTVEAVAQEQQESSVAVEQQRPGEAAAKQQQQKQQQKPLPQQQQQQQEKQPPQRQEQKKLLQQHEVQRLLQQQPEEHKPLQQQRAAEATRTDEGNTAGGTRDGCNATVSGEQNASFMRGLSARTASASELPRSPTEDVRPESPGTSGTHDAFMHGDPADTRNEPSYFGNAHPAFWRHPYFIVLVVLLASLAIAKYLSKAPNTLRCSTPNLEPVARLGDSPLPASEEPDPASNEEDVLKTLVWSLG